MGKFLNNSRKTILKGGKKLKQMAHHTRPYALALARTVGNNPEFLPQLAGIGAGVASTAALAGLTGASVAAAPVTGGTSTAATAPSLAAAAGSGLATLQMARSTFGEIGKSYKKELKRAKTKKGGRIKIDQDSVRKLREVQAATKESKGILNRGRRPIPGGNLNE